MYGKFKKAHYYPEKVLRNGQVMKARISPKGYYGMFWGTVSNEDGFTVEYASDYFLRIEDKGKEAWDIINDKLHRHLQTHIGEVDFHKYHWQCGFGGDEMDGLLDFWLPTRIKCPPDMEFKILDKKYVMSFDYSGDDSSLSSEEEDKDDDY
jgi:hypothetical protein